MNNCIITIEPSSYTLADIYDYLKQHNYFLIRSISQTLLDELTSVNSLFNEPTHIAQKVYVRQQDKDEDKPIYLIYSNLGHLYFSENDCLEDFILSEPNLFFDYKVYQDNAWLDIYDRDFIRFDKQSSKKWQAQFDFEEVFDHFGFNGQNDYAPFVGFFSVSN